MATKSENLFTSICGFKKTKDIVIISLNTKGSRINSRQKKRKKSKQNVNPGIGHVIILVKKLDVFVVNH